ncbi:MAG TPA: hypothetical protein VHB97_15100 [Polyangia bacterium]|jgi:hypothetical protein|nr:hypothetical protein [Polyangia bacterium]
MSVASGDLGEITGGHIRIGAESHVGRNVGIVVGVMALGVGIFGFTSYSNKQDAGKLARLDSFRAAYADKCEAPAFRGEAPSLLKDTYLRSERLQAAVDKQQAALASGTPCDEIARALRTADFPMGPQSSSTAQ